MEQEQEIIQYDLNSENSQDDIKLIQKEEYMNNVQENNSIEDQSINLNQNNILLSDYIKCNNLEEELHKIQILANSENHRSSRTGQRKKRLKLPQNKNIQHSLAGNINGIFSNDKLNQQELDDTVQQNSNTLNTLQLNNKQKQMSENLNFRDEYDQDNIQIDQIQSSQYQGGENLKVQYLNLKKEDIRYSESCDYIQKQDGQFNSLKVTKSEVVYDEQEYIQNNKRQQSKMSNFQSNKKRNAQNLIYCQTENINEDETIIIDKQDKKKNDNLYLNNQTQMTCPDITQIKMNDSSEQDYEDFENKDGQILRSYQQNKQLEDFPITERESENDYLNKSKNQKRTQNKIQSENNKANQSNICVQNNDSNIWQDSNFEQIKDPIKLVSSKENTNLPQQKESDSLPSVPLENKSELDVISYLNKNNAKINQKRMNLKKSQFHHMESENFQSDQMKEKDVSSSDDEHEIFEYENDQYIRQVKIDKQKKNIDRNFKFTHTTCKKIKSQGESQVELKLSGITDGFKKRYMILTDDKLYFFQNSQKERITNVVCFRAYMVKIKQINNIIQLKLSFFNNKNWEIKLVNKEDCANWTQKIENTIKKSYLYDGFGILKQFSNTYYNEDILTEIEFKRYCETGDLVLFETDNIGAVLQRKVTRSKYDHVGIIVRFSDNDVRIFDANCDTGVTLMQWEQFIDENDLYTKVAIRRLTYSNKAEEAQQILMTLMGETLGKKYGISVSKLLNVHKQYMTADQNQLFIENIEKLDSKEKQKYQKLAQETAINSNKEEYFCSEIAAIYYKRLGIFNQVIPSSQYWPVSFTQNKNLQLQKGARFEYEITVLLNRHRDPFNLSFD